MTERGGRVTLSGLRLLVAVADAGGFSEAAAELGMSQSSLSEAVAGLERAVGTPLLHRTRTGTLPTEAGQRALEHARRALGAADDFVLAALEPAELQGELRVVSMRSAATHLLPPVLRAFGEQHPGVRVSVQDDESGDEQAALLALLDQRADVGIVPLPVPSGLLAHPLLQDPYVAVFPASRGRAPLDWAEMQGQSLLLNAFGDACTNRVLSYLDRHGVEPGPLRLFQNDSVILSMVGHGLGFSILPALAAQPLPAGLIALPLPAPLSRTLAVTTLASRASLPAIRRFVGLLRAGAEAPAVPV